MGGVHAGPESKVVDRHPKRGKTRNVFQVLDGLSWEEVKNMQDAQTSQVDGYGGMKVKLLFVASIFPHFSFFLISFIF